MRISRVFRLTLIALFLVSGSAIAQNEATLRGIVTDPEGGVFQGVFIQLKNTATSAVLNAQSESGGKYNLAPLTPGMYQLSVDVPGMKHFEQANIAIEAGQTRELNVRLDDGPSLRTLGEDPATIAAVFIYRAPPPDGPTPRTADGKPDLSGVWLGGPAPPDAVQMLPWAEDLKKERLENHSKDHPGVSCLPAGPAPLLSPGLFEFVQAPKELIALFEGDTPGYRQVFLDGRVHPVDYGPSWLGHSVGRWEGETLVIDSVGFHDKGWIDYQGNPHSDKLRVTQRIRRPDLGHLEIEVTIDDPGAYAKTWTVKNGASLVVGEELEEFICNENNQDVGHLVGR